MMLIDHNERKKVKRFFTLHFVRFTVDQEQQQQTAARKKKKKETIGIKFIIFQLYFGLKRPHYLAILLFDFSLYS